MSEDRLVRAREIVQEYDRSRASVVELAELASLAVRIEPELLRALRLRLAPHLDVGAEGDLWFSSLVQARGADGITFSAEVVEVLQSRLCESEHRLGRAWEVTRICHQEISPALRLEEEVTYQALSGADQEVIKKTLAPALVALTREGRTGLAPWAARALPRLPQNARSTSVAWILSFAASRSLGEPILIGEDVPADLMKEDLTSVLADLGEVELGIRLQEGELELGEIRGVGTSIIRVIDTVPRLVEVRWQGEHQEYREVLCISRESVVRQQVGLGAVRLRTLSGAVYDLRPLTSQGKNELGSLLNATLHWGSSARTENIDHFQEMLEVGGAVRLLNPRNKISLSMRDLGRLKLGERVEQELQGGEGHRYELPLGANQFAHVIVQQQGVDVAVLVQKPGQEGWGRVDSPNGSEGPEIVYLVAEQAGIYGIEVVCEDLSTPLGRYEIRLEELRAAETDDRALFEAWRLFRRGEAQRNDHPREALGFYEQALLAWRALGRRDWEAETLHRIGRVQRVLGQYPASLEAFQEALPWFRQQGPKTRECTILNEMGSLFFYQGNLDEALRSSEEALTLFREIDKPGLEAEALSNLGYFWSRRGQTEKALELFTQARDLARRSGDPLSGFYALYGLGDLYLFLGQLDVSQDALEEALRMADQAGAPNEKMDVLRSLADLHLRRKNLDVAQGYLEQALTLARARENRDQEAILLNTFGTLALERKQPQEAQTAFENALALSRKTGNRYGQAFALLNLGRARYDAEDVEGALRAHEEAAVLFQALEHHRGLVSTLYGSARALNALGRFAEAEQRLIRVGDNIEFLRGGTESPDLRSTFFATRQHYFDLNVDVLMNLDLQRPGKGYDHLALEVNERRRARSLREELGGRAKIRPDASPELVARRDELQKEIEETEEHLLTLRGEEEGRAKALEQQLRSALTELERVRTESIKEEKRRGGHVEPRPLGFKGLQELLDPQTVLLVFSLGDRQSYLWCIADRGRLESRRLPARSWIEERVDKLSRAWSRRDREGRLEERWAEELSQELLGPVEKLLGTRRLVIVADGALQGLSFAALPDPADPEAPLLVRHEIAYLPSASVLAVLRQDLRSRATAPGRLIVMADPVFGPEDPRFGNRVPTIARPDPDPDLGRAVRDLGIEALQPLPFSALEAEAISGLLPPDQRRVLSGFDANLTAVEKGALRPYAIVHFATHGLVHPQHPELSGLVLSRVDPAGALRQGHLRAYQIADLDLRADLVVLSACETGVGTELRGEGTQALTRSFMRAGAPRLVVSLWAVSDGGTAEFMERFYRGLLKYRLSPPEALRCAQFSMLQEKRWSAPFHWAPFIFQGEWEKRVAKTPESDGFIEREAAGGMAIKIPDDGFPPPGDDPPRKWPDLSRRIETNAPKEGA